uniref:Uncharacterized protein n=1 Tax=Oncorhynchus kisutch TaxID=8019 RepID=A0A8C7HBT1_ONCKI
MFSHQFIHILVEVVCVQFRDINCCNSGHNLADVAQYYMFSFIPYYHYILPSLPTSGCCAALGSMWSCPLACHGRPNMTSPSVTTLTLKTAATIVGTGATMPTTATVSAGGVEVVGADRGLVPDPGHVAAVIDPVPAAMTAACTAPHLIPNIGRGPAPLCGPSPGHLLGVVLGQGPGPEGPRCPALSPDPALPAIRGIVVPDLQARKRAPPQGKIDLKTKLVPIPLQPTGFSLAAICFVFVPCID